MIDIENVNTVHKINMHLGFQIGLRVPEMKFYFSTPEEEQMLMRASGEWYEEQEMFVRKKPGCRISCFDYWDGEHFLFPHIVINDRSLFNGGQGPRLDANSVTMFRNIDGICRDEFRKVADFIREREDTYRGYVALDVTVSPSGVWYNGIQFGLVPDYIFLLSKLYGVDPSEEPDWSHPTDFNFVCSLRLWAYPYHESNNARVIEVLPFSNGMDVIYSEDCYIVMAGGKRIYDCWKKLYDSIPDGIEEFGVCFRTDGDDLPKRIYHTLKQEKLVCRGRLF